VHVEPTVEAAARSIALQSTPEEVLAAAVDAARHVLGADAAFAAVDEGQGFYPMRLTSGIRDPRFTGIVVRPATGLGGQVLLCRQPRWTGDYAHDPAISRDFVHVVSDIEGLDGMGCVPIVGPVGVEALLYVGSRQSDIPGDVALTTLARVASYAELTLDNLAARRQELELELLRERQRLASELHDSVAQMLFSIGVAAHYSRGKQDPVDLLATLQEIETTAAAARRQLRETLEHLGRSDEGIGFEARLEGEIRLFERRCGCRVRTIHRGERRELPRPVESLVLDTVGEGLRNASKHDQATVAVVSLVYEPGGISLVLQNDGSTDAEPESGASSWLGSGSGSGLSLLRQRADQLGGALELLSDRGMRVLRLEVPTLDVLGGPR
jgi:signal transduction histidine kinase